jgi:Kef-type K+ transport system membrane component KefB
MFGAEELSAITDYALAAASLIFAIAIGRSIGPHNRVSAWFWCAAFIAAVVAGAAGGAFHSLDADGQVPTRELLWTLIIVSMGVFGAFVTAGIHAANVRREDGTVGWLAAGIVTTLIGAAVQRLPFPESAKLDENGVYHLIQIVGLYLFYRCARTVHDRPGVLQEVRSDAQPEVARRSATSVER